MTKVKQIEIDDISAVIYYLKDVVEVHFICQNTTYVNAAQKLLKYLESEAFITSEPVKLISLNIR